MLWQGTAARGPAHCPPDLYRALRRERAAKRLRLWLASVLLPLASAKSGNLWICPRCMRLCRKRSATCAWPALMQLLMGVALRSHRLGRPCTPLHKLCSAARMRNNAYELFILGLTVRARARRCTPPLQHCSCCRPSADARGGRRRRALRRASLRRTLI